MTAVGKDRHLTVLMGEYGEASVAIRDRIDLQHRNMNVLVLLCVGVSGYLVQYATMHGLDTGQDALTRTPLTTLVVLLAVVVNLFVWRHLDHDVNILDTASYVNDVLRPAIREVVEADPVLSWEAFLHDRRLGRRRRFGPLLDLGKDDVPQLVLATTFLTVGWTERLTVGQPGGQAHLMFDMLLAVASVLTPVSVWMAVAVGRAYRTVGMSPASVG
jgi:hypothetical protein